MASSISWILSKLRFPLAVNLGGTGKTSLGEAAVGVVSQSGGVPTGAIVESGIGASGEYIKYANGTMICRYTISGSYALDTAYLGAFTSGWITWTFPAAFASRPNVTVTPRDDTALFGLVATGGNGTQENIRLGQNTSSPAATRTANLVAIGRWY